MIVKGKDRQTLSDICLQYAGSAEAVFTIARANGISLDAEVAGMELSVETLDSKVVSYYKSNGIVPANEIT